MSDSKPNSIPRVLTIAGSDPSGGAGIEADIKVITAHGCYGMTAITALTAQNTEGVRGIYIVPPEFLRSSLEAVLDDIGADVIKTGMLAGEESIKVVAETLKKYGIKKTVIDTVMVSTQGSELLPSSAVTSFIENIFPHTYLLTPNIPEALMLLKYLKLNVPKIASVSTMVEVATALQAHGPKNILLKGGHVPFRKIKDQYYLAENDEQKEVVVDVLFNGTESIFIENPYINSKNTHGTGCSLASSIASNIARGFSLEDAVRSSCSYISAAIKTSTPNLGKGNGPINHLHSNYILPFAPGHFVDYLLSHPKIKDRWRAYTHHEFVNQLGAGTLEKESFKHYLIQDYLFLVQFARTNALAGYKSNHIDDITRFTGVVLHIQNEMKLHVRYCATFGISREQMNTAEESQACTTYTRFVLDIGATQDLFALNVATAACLIGYRDIAVRLDREYKDGKAKNMYWKWVENYTGESYRNAYNDGRELLEKYAVKQSTSRIEELVEIFAKTTKMEEEFWTMGLERK
ncbi:trifunctional hydroxymethylpyrimidine kinase/phosphomethylpyrimidine kinase/thiaminase [Maublancomyces gigas]|uniref:Trifunctional hydroxymethylpyrimidine kinase/phosphomethylpyrimidine kinase/thiaminase n=1 Tax=Discina gigas TaxID=1032678 RepID=A0ABR3GBM1_9PEZI